MSLRVAFTSPHEGGNLGRLEAFLGFLGERLSPEDYAEAESLLHAAVCPSHAARRHRERAEREAGQ